jgi:hypothetical protein
LESGLQLALVVSSGGVGAYEATCGIIEYCDDWKSCFVYYVAGVGGVNIPLTLLFVTNILEDEQVTGF